MNAKHQFKYTYNETDLEEFSPVEVTFEVPGDVTLQQMLYNFERYLQAAGFVFSGKLDFVEDTYPEYLDELDGTLYDFKDEEPQGGCMADFDKDILDDSEVSNVDEGRCGCDCTSSPLEKFNEGLAKLEKEIKTQKKISEMANKSADMVKDFNDAYEKLTHEQKMKCYEEALKMSGLHEEVKKNRWFHGLCNPSSPDWKKNK